MTSISGEPGNFPIIQGVDVVGRIAAVGEGVAATRLGGRVLCNFIFCGDAVTSRRRAESVRGLGPAGVALRDHVGEDLVGQARRALGRDAFDVVADVVGGEHFPDYLALLGAGGGYVNAGAMAGAVVPFDIRTLYLKKLTLMSVSVGHRHHFEAVLDHIRAGRIGPLLAKSFPISEIRAAQELFMSKDFFGNIVVRP